MNRLFVIAGALAVAATVLPAGALATWYVAGTYEPDTLHDVQGGFMHENANVGPDNAVYFNAFPVEYLTSMNPNVAETGSRILVAGAREYNAMLGVWKDCNGDNYVGLQSSAAWSYAAVALVSQDVCPAGSLHNDGKWVNEYLPIGRLDEDAVANDSYSKFVINDPESNVWADFGLPGAGAAATCPIVPPPHGTTAGTGAAIRWIDCLAGGQITGAVNAADPNGDLGLGFEDPNNPQDSDSLLNQELPQSLWGNPRTCETGTFQLAEETNGCPANDQAFSTYDCSSEPITTVADPTGGVLLSEDLEVRQPSPSTDVSPTGSVSMGLNETAEGAEGCTGANDYNGVHGTAFFYTDGAVDAGAQGTEKFQADIDFAFTDAGIQSDCVDEEIEGTPVEQCVRAEVFGENMGDGMGLAPGRTFLEPYWGASVVYVTTPQSVNRNTLAVQPGLYVTFYGKIGSASTSLGYVGLNQGEYGAEVCDGNYASNSNPNDGWNCDAGQWYKEANGNDISTEYSARVGDTYQFRDIDCDDGTLVRGVPVYASLASLSAAGPCVDAPQ